MTEVHYAAGSPYLGSYYPRTDRIVIHEGLLRHPQVLKEILVHEWKHVELYDKFIRNPKITLSWILSLYSWFFKTRFLDYRDLWNIYRNQEILDLYRKVSEDIGFRAGPIGLIPYLIPRICRLVNWVEGLR